MGTMFEVTNSGCVFFNFFQHYAQNFEFYDGNNLIFLMVGGDRDMNIGWLKQGFIAEQAEKFRAALFTIEHRFYGKSQPKP